MIERACSTTNPSWRRRQRRKSSHKTNSTRKRKTTRIQNSIERTSQQFKIEVVETEEYYRKSEKQKEK